MLHRAGGGVAEGDPAGLGRSVRDRGQGGGVGGAGDGSTGVPAAQRRTAGRGGRRQHPGVDVLGVNHDGLAVATADHVPAR